MDSSILMPIMPLRAPVFSDKFPGNDGRPVFCAPRKMDDPYGVTVLAPSAFDLSKEDCNIKLEYDHLLPHQLIPEGLTSKVSSLYTAQREAHKRPGLRETAFGHKISSRRNFPMREF